MLSIDFIRENAKQVSENAEGRGVNVDIEKLLKLDEDRRNLIQKVDEQRAKRNKISQKRGGKPSAEDLKEAKQAKAATNKYEAELDEVTKKYQDLLNQVPNMNHDSVKIGEGESANEVLREEGKKPEFDFEVLDHEQIGEAKDLIDLETGAYASGSRFYYLKNEAVLLEFALINWLMQKYTELGFTPVTTPTLVKEHMMYSTGFFPADKNEIYHVNPGEDDLYLVGTSEVTLAGLHMKKPLIEADLPKRYVGFSSCFRREAGSYGKDTKGIFRVHQFDKVEMYSFCHPDKSWQEHDYLLSVEEEILQELGLHYQVVNVGSGDLGASAAKKYDCEVWIPSQQRYRELTSCSNTTDFQSRRGGIKYKKESGEMEFAHTLNGTAMASTRTILAVLENNQQKDGSVVIPEVLRPFMGGREKI